MLSIMCWSCAAILFTLHIGCVNPISDPEFPTLTVTNVTRNEAHLRLCWKRPSHLGGLTLKDIIYRVVLKSLESNKINSSNVTCSMNESCCYHGTYTNIRDTVEQIDIDITVHPIVSHRHPSMSMQFPNTSPISCEYRQANIATTQDIEESLLRLPISCLVCLLCSNP